MQKHNFYKENQGIYSYLTYKIAENEQIDDMTVGMITNNRIQGIMSVIYTQMDSDIYIKYNISSKISVQEFFSGSVNKMKLLNVFSGILTAIMSAEEYMIDVNSLIYDLNYIYVDVKTCRAEMICVPVIEERESVNLGLFFKNIMFSTRFDQTENSDYVAKIMNYLNSTPNLSPSDFKKMVDMLLNQQIGEKNNRQGYQANREAAPIYKQMQGFQNESLQGENIINSNPQNKAVQEIFAQSRNIMNESKKNVNVQMESFQRGQSVAGRQNIHMPMTNPNAGVIQSKKTPPNLMMPPSKDAGHNQSNLSNESGGEMSWLYLMQHYNKENAAVYKAQKERKKAAKSANNQGNNPNMGQNNVSIPRSVPSNGAGNILNRQNYNIPPNENYMGMKVPLGERNMSQAVPVVGKDMNIPTKHPVNNTGFSIRGQENNINQMPNSTRQQNGYEMSGPVPQPTYTPEPLGRREVDFGDTVLLDETSDSSETTLLGSTVTEIKPYLVRLKNNDKVIIDKPVFRIGKDRRSVDYCIEGNTAISRNHAKIIFKERKYFLVDTGSTNHTYINDSKIQIEEGEEIPIVHGTKIRFADEEFEFRIY